MKQINDRWYYLSGHHFSYNAGLYTSHGRAILIDPGMTRDEIKNIHKFLEDSCLKSEGIILTHFHWDHILGVNNFGITDIYTHKRFPGELEDHRQATYRSIKKWAIEANEETLSLEKFPVPNHLMDDGNHLTVGGSNLLLLHSPGHTMDHLSVFDDKSGVLWAGDILSDLEIPFISGSILSFQSTLEKLVDLEITTIIPGHGSPTHDQGEVHKRLDEDLEYIYILRSSTEAAICKGLSMEETVKSCRNIPIRFPEDNLTAHEWNIESAYRELGGVTGIIPVGWQKEWVDL